MRMKIAFFIDDGADEGGYSHPPITSPGSRRYFSLAGIRNFGSESLTCAKGGRPSRPPSSLPLSTLVNNLYLARFSPPLLRLDPSPCRSSAGHGLVRAALNSPSTVPVLDPPVSASVRDPIGDQRAPKKVPMSEAIHSSGSCFSYWPCPAFFSPPIISSFSFAASAAALKPPPSFQKPAVISLRSMVFKFPLRR